MYADNITESMRKTIEETDRRRLVQMKYNEEHHITPQQIVKAISGGLRPQTSMDTQEKDKGYGEAYIEPEGLGVVADPVVNHMTPEELDKAIAESKRLMNEAAKRLDFLQAAQYRDEALRLSEMRKNLKNEEL